MNKLVVLGSGIAGLTALSFAKKFGFEVTCYTRDELDTIGGLCASFKIKDFTFDNAVHFSFAKEAEVREVFDKLPYYTHKPVSYNFDRYLWLKHPVQNNLYPLINNEKILIIDSFVNTRNNITEIKHYEDWLISQYGYEFAERYPIKYTKKYWSVEASELSTSWVGSRMNQVDLKDVLKGSFEQLDENHYYTQEMRYPKQGGYQGFIQSLIDESKKEIQVNHELLEIDTVNKTLTFSNGNIYDYDNLISSIPLPDLVKSIKGVSNEMLELANSLFATSVDLISVGFSRNIIDKLWFYIYDEDILAARAYSPSIKSPANVPEGCSSLQFEIYSSIKSKHHYTVQEMIDNTLYAIEKMGIGAKDDILFMEHKKLKYGNVVFDLGMEERRDKLLDYVRGHGIETIGRFGLWDYLWSNQAFMSGVNAVNKLNLAL